MTADGLERGELSARDTSWCATAPSVKDCARSRAFWWLIRMYGKRTSYAAGRCAGPVPMPRPKSAFETVLAHATAADQAGMADTYNELAICNLELRDYAESERNLRAALQLDPENTKIMSNMGILAMKRGLLEEARRYFETIRELDPNDPLAPKYLDQLGALPGERRRPRTCDAAADPGSLDCGPDGSRSGHAVWVVVAAFGTLIVVLVALGSHQRRARRPARCRHRARIAARGTRLPADGPRIARAADPGGRRPLPPGDGLCFATAPCWTACCCAAGRRCPRCSAPATSVGWRSCCRSRPASRRATAATIRSSSSLGAGTRIVVTPALLGSYESEVIAGCPTRSRAASPATTPAASCAGAAGRW